MTDEKQIREAALLETVRAMAQIDLEYTDERLEWFCPACHAFVSADWGSSRKPYGMLGADWAKHRFKHEDGCPVVKARALLAADGEPSPAA